MTYRKNAFATLAALFIVMAACSDDGDRVGRRLPSDGVDDLPDDGDDLLLLEEQIDRGAALFAQNCAECHGDMGQGSSIAPPLVGPDALPLEPRPDQILRTEPFITAFDVYDFARVNMPFDDPGILSDREYLDIIVFDLDANGFPLDEPLDEDDLMEIVINEPGT